MKNYALSSQFDFDRALLTSRKRKLELFVSPGVFVIFSRLVTEMGKSMREDLQKELTQNPITFSSESELNQGWIQIHDICLDSYASYTMTNSLTIQQLSFDIIPSIRLGRQVLSCPLSPLVTMSIISWICRDLGGAMTIQALKSIFQTDKTLFILFYNWNATVLPRHIDSIKGLQLMLCRNSGFFVVWRYLDRNLNI